MKRAVIVAMAAAAMVLGLGCARDLARASSGVIGCAPEDIAIDDVSVGWSETSWAASCGGTTFRCAGEGAPWCAPAMGASPGTGSEHEAAADAPAQPATAELPARAPSPAPSTPKAEPTPAEPSTEAAPESGPAELPPGHPIPEGFTDAPH
jgi:hypothetical protein